MRYALLTHRPPEQVAQHMLFTRLLYSSVPKPGGQARSIPYNLAGRPHGGPHETPMCTPR